MNKNIKIPEYIYDKIIDLSNSLNELIIFIDNQSMEDNDELDVFDILEKELNNWEIKTSTLGYRCIMCMPKCCSPSNTYEEAMDYIANYVDKSTSSVATAIDHIAKHAKFENSEYFDSLKNRKKKNQKITKEILINLILDSKYF